MRTKVLMTLALLCAVAQGAWAGNPQVQFNVRSWDETNKKVITEQKTVECTLLEGQNNEWLLLTDGYYAVKGDVRRRTLNLRGTVHLILLDDSKMTCTGGVILTDYYTERAELYIYSQSDGDNEGRLEVTNDFERSAGITAMKSAPVAISSSMVVLSAPLVVLTDLASALA